MKTTFPSTPIAAALLAALAGFAAPRGHAQEVSGSGGLAAYLARTAANAAEREPAAPAADVQPAVRLPCGGLRLSSLQTAGGLHSGARGLTPPETWRQVFPAKRR